MRQRLVSSLLALGALFLLAGCGGDSTNSAPSAADAGARLAASSVAQLGSAAPYRPTGQIVAASNFRPETDGFSFENYGSGNQDLTAAQLVDLFGPEVCAQGQGASCVLAPPAQTWMTKENRSMQGGHCFGFSLTSLMMYQKLLNPLAFGGPTVPALSLFGNVPLQERIAESWALQDSSKVRGAAITGTPNHVLEFLIKALGNPSETYTLAIFNRDIGGISGHAVTPYAVEDKGNGRFAVLIYDNNYPKITRSVTFNKTRDTWSYDTAPNPEKQSELWHGDAKTRSAELFPTNPAVGRQPCPFCQPSELGTSRPSDRNLPASLTPGEYEEVSLTADPVNHGHLVIIDAAGRKTGFVNGKLVNEIPGARVVAPMLTRNFQEVPEPEYRIPRDVKFTVSLDGGPLQAPDMESVSVIGPGYSGVASNITLQPGQEQHLELTGNGASLSYRAGAGAAQTPHLEIGLQRPGSDYRFNVTTPPIQDGSAVTATAQPDAKRLSVNAANVKTGGRYSLAVAQLKAPRTQKAGRSVRVPAGGSADVALGG
jgi:hypothetical protein